tara:strand:+ start:412 stop:588 length:177 start_codon:yes stop_codon:yes gene_type:complete
MVITGISKQEVSHIILACETLMEQLRDGQGDRGFARWEDNNKEKWYAIADIVLKLNNL